MVCTIYQIYTVCPGSSDQFYKVSYNIKWVTTSWTYSRKSMVGGSRGSLITFYPSGWRRIWQCSFLEHKNPRNVIFGGSDWLHYSFLYSCIPHLRILNIGISHVIEYRVFLYITANLNGKSRNLNFLGTQYVGYFYSRVVPLGHGRFSLYAPPPQPILKMVSNDSSMHT